ncbi:MAG: T9SS type A sorting domain-containing protein [Crocinitomicaceae bacterium]|nr:T9SS type A sorting domain-containing protein [Crocinitomicaceae bacterium]
MAKIFQGDSTSSSKIVFTFDGKYVYQGDSTSSSKRIYTWDGKHIFQGDSTSSSKIMYTWDGKYLYQGDSTSSSKRLYTWDGKYFYQGDSSSSSKRIYTFDGKHLYQGDSTSSSRIMYTFDSPVPPAGHIQQVVLANSPVSQEVLNVLNSMNIPNGIKNQINNAQTGVSAMTYLNNEISFASTERNSLIDERIRLFLNDTLIQNPLDSIAIILKEEKREIRKKQLCDTYIGKGDTVKATETRDTLALEYGYNNYVKMADVQLEVFSLPSSCFAVITDPNIKQEVEYVAYDPNDRINAVRGEALLAVAFDSLFLANIEPLEPIGSGLRMGQNNLEQQKVSAKESSLSIYPNPSDGGIVNLEIKGDELLNNVSLEIYTITGQLVASYSFSGENRMVTINTNKLIPGVYFVKLFSNTQLIETKKLLINN